MALPPWARILLYAGGAIQAGTLIGAYLKIQHLHAYVRVALLAGWSLICASLAAMVWYEWMFASYPPLRETLWTVNALVLFFVPMFCWFVTVRNGGNGNGPTSAKHRS